ncbi:MAG: PAS domain S-box protein, partial [Candidatus Thorarchaeota archaeon]
MKREIERISEILKMNPVGMTISGIARKLGINRNTVAKYLDIMLTTGEVEMRQIGSAKLYSLSHRIPLAALLDASSDAIAVLNGNLMVIQANESFSRLLNITKNDTIGLNLRDSPFSSNAGSEIEKRVLDSIKGDHSISEFDYESEKGSIFLNVSSLPILLGDGSNGACLIVEDITARKQAEEALKESEEKYRHLFNNLSDIVFVANLKGQFIQIIDTGANLLGYTTDELSEMTPA